MYRKGSNQHKIHYKYLLNVRPVAWRSIFEVALVCAVLIPLAQPRITSPCPETGCFSIKTVYAKENMSPEEYLLVQAKRVFGLEYIADLISLVNKESSFNQFARNPSSGACGYFQALPCEKMKCNLYDAECQINWGLGYIKARYGNPSNAWAFHKVNGWY